MNMSVDAGSEEEIISQIHHMLFPFLVFVLCLLLVYASASIYKLIIVEVFSVYGLALVECGDDLLYFTTLGLEIEDQKEAAACYCNRQDQKDEGFTKETASFRPFVFPYDVTRITPVLDVKFLSVELRKLELFVLVRVLMHFNLVGVGQFSKALLRKVSTIRPFERDKCHLRP